jgi:hypothetical protein
VLRAGELEDGCFVGWFGHGSQGLGGAPSIVGAPKCTT